MDEPQRRSSSIGNVVPFDYLSASAASSAATADPASTSTSAGAWLGLGTTALAELTAAARPFLGLRGKTLSVLAELVAA
jgi:hypothetical protein